jgi:F-type H+/Na+-transporting ATPase subunit alpha
MADLTIRPEDVTSALRAMLEGYEPTMSQEQVGRVTDAGDGIANVSWLPGALAASP